MTTAPPDRLLYLITDPMSTRLLRGQLRWMVEAGFDVHLACAQGPDLAAFAREEGATWHVLPFVRPVRPLADVRALVATVRLLRRLRPAVINASTPKAGLLGTFAGRITGVPVRVYVIRGLRFEGSSGWRRRLLLNLDRLAARSATHVVGNSPSLLRMAEREGLLAEGRGIVIGAGSGNGLDARRFASLPTAKEVRSRLGIRNDAVVLGFVGRLTRDKGVADLLQVLDQVGDARDDVRLILVGDHEAGDPLAPDVRRRIVDDDRILHLRWLEDPAWVFPAMDVLVFPSYREGLPNVPLEAQAAGVPVVAYAATGTVDAVRHGETGELVPTGDVAALARAVAGLLAAPLRRATYAEQGRAWVAGTFAPELLWGAMAARYRGWLEEGRASRDGAVQ